MLVQQVPPVLPGEPILAQCRQASQFADRRSPCRSERPSRSGESLVFSLHPLPCLVGCAAGAAPNRRPGHCPSLSPVINALGARRLRGAL